MICRICRGKGWYGTQLIGQRVSLSCRACMGLGRFSVLVLLQQMARAVALARQALPTVLVGRTADGRLDDSPWELWRDEGGEG
jgi:hypothetical protein